ncbi:xanthine dehydrogenase [Bacteriovorax stolpii]|uniref:xanthine dehydrogenase small subunit n=1 Tax=Bacteriovorax stolpii TaxID=960 RepID=UPI001157131C|nr:FAD binding domain-containing protein [Bacteriovorax stolpii]QDK40523.1 xanthine dehydrogenase [Bacteriovorax stolpii]
MKTTNTITTKINDQRVEIKGENAFMTLGNFLRNEESLTGTKIVCAEGDCGACTVLIAKDIDASGKLEFKSVNSCILPLYLIDGAQVVTVEGIGKNVGMNIDLHEVQQKMIDHNGAQCGYCTPGFICAMAGAVEKVKSCGGTLTEKKAKNFLTGNLCRCTGYQPIIDAATSIDLNKVELLKDRYHSPDWISEMKAIKSQTVEMKFTGKSIFLPATLKEALNRKSEKNDVRLIAGSTDIGVVVNKGKLATPDTMALYHIEDLNVISHDDKFINVGATVTLTQFEDYVEKHFPEMSRLLRIFASPQIKNQGTVVGNVVNASPIADTIPFLVVSDAVVELESTSGKREVVLPNFYIGYKKLDIKPDEIVTRIKIPVLAKNEKTRLYKVSMRKDLDISAVTFAARIVFEGKKMTKVAIALGGVAATVVRLSDIEAKLTGKEFSEKVFHEAAASLDQYIKPLSDLRASKEYRMLVARNYFKKFAQEVGGEL